jgi:hypothetical protein
MTCAGPVHDHAIWRAENLSRFKFLLGHASVQTTERYLGCGQKLSQAVNNNLGLEDPDDVVTPHKRISGPRLSSV